MRLLSLLLAACTLTLHAAKDPFIATVEHIQPNRLPLTIHKGNNLQTLQAAINGIPCTLLFDTGATHTTFNRSFIKKNFPNAPLLRDLAFQHTNVAMPTERFHIERLTLGNTDLCDFSAMVLPLDHLSQAVGTPIDGILGMNSIRYAPLVMALKEGWIAWTPKLPENPFATPLPNAPCGNPLTLMLYAHSSTPKSPHIGYPLLVDTGSSYTFVPEECWPAADQAVTMSTSDVNAGQNETFRRGKSSSLFIGPKRFTIAPFFGTNRRYQLGADIMTKHVFFFDPKTNTLFFIQ